MSEFTLIEHRKTLEDACAEWSAADVLALDTEFMRVKTYFPSLCLVQIRTESEGRTFLLDSLAVDDLGPLETLIRNERVDTIIHSFRQDLEALDTRIDAMPGSLFDTQIAAAFCGLGDQVSYASLVKTVTGTVLPKAHTRADWSRRPLPEEQMSYAADDVRYLHSLRDFLGEHLDRHNRMAWFREECQRQLDHSPWRPDPEQSWYRLKGAAALPAHAQETARQLALWRENEAVRSNRPREWVLPTRGLLAISQAGPQSMTALARVPGVGPNMLRQYGRQVIHICRDTPRSENADVIWPNVVLPPDERLQVKCILKLVQDVAKDLGMSSSLLANRFAVEEFVRGTVELDMFRGWRREVVGNRILAEFS